MYRRRKSLEGVEQLSESHCGPAVVQMLLSVLDVITDQAQVTKAAGVEETIEEHGTRVDQLAKAVKVIAPGTSFWVKENSSIEDLLVVLENDYPVGVEWQGIFDGEEEDDDGYGHYSIVKDIDIEKGVLLIADPYKEFFNNDRIVAIDLFKKRWWDYNEVKDEKNKPRYKKDVRLMFIVTESSVTFPEKIGMAKL